MLEKRERDKIEEITKEFFAQMTIEILSIHIGAEVPTEEARDIVDLDIKLEEPQILIGQGGQTLFEIQRLLKNVSNRRLQKLFYLNLDINEYKKKKIEYLKDIAKNLADQVSLTKEEKALLPMPAYERRIIHAELSQRTDVVTESQGDGFDRHIVIKPR